MKNLFLCALFTTGLLLVTACTKNTAQGSNDKLREYVNVHSSRIGTSLRLYVVHSRITLENICFMSNGNTGGMAETSCQPFGY